jgi:rsbT antagonist protein RsbS
MDRTTNPIPVIELWGQIVVSLQGEIRDSQMSDLHTRVLRRIRDHGAEGLVIDASGVWLMDSHLCATLGRLASAARMMGTTPVLCGLTPEVVLTLQSMGIDLEDIETALGLESALEKLGLRLERTEDDGTDDELASDDDEESAHEREAR